MFIFFLFTEFSHFKKRKLMENALKDGVPDEEGDDEEEDDEEEDEEKEDEEKEDEEEEDEEEEWDVSS